MKFFQKKVEKRYLQQETITFWRRRSSPVRQWGGGGLADGLGWKNHRDGRERAPPPPKGRKGSDCWLHRTRCMTLTAVAYRRSSTICVRCCCSFLSPTQHHQDLFFFFKFFFISIKLVVRPDCRITFSSFVCVCL
jgi:hypothetical protein